MEKYSHNSSLTATETPQKEEPSPGAWIADLVADLVTDLVFVADAEYRFSRVNKAFEECTGYKQEELVGKKIHLILDKGRIEAIREELWERDFISNIEMTFLTKGGSRFPVIVTVAAAKSPRGKPAGLIFEARDMSQINELISDLQSSNERLEQTNRELKRTQEQLLRAERLAIIGELAATVGHELRNPLGVIGNASYYLNVKLSDIVDERVKRQLEILEREVNTCNKIVVDLLDFSRPRMPAMARTNINAVVEQALSRSRIPDNLKVVNGLEEGLPQVMADSDQIRQVFLNIVSNAAQAMDDRGKLEIRTRKKGDFVEIEFEDDGSGISKENLGKIFDPLFTTKAKGIGLGLAVSKALIKGHHGIIEVRSELDKGTIFTVKLPIDEKEGRLKVSILIVDDDASFRETLSAILDAKGYLVVDAGDGFEAIQRAKEMPFNFILMDIKMPGINGIETYKEIKKVRPEATVMMMTAYAVEDLVREALKEGASGVVYKPFDIEELVGVIEGTKKQLITLRGRGDV